MKRSNAIITASYAPDYERCRILCESIDRHVTGYSCHYLLVAEPDRQLFSSLEGPKRQIITDDELLPWWIKRLPPAISPGGRRVWLSARTVPMRGWHTQQIMRIAVAAQLPDDGLFYCDSDTAFVKAYDLSAMWNGNAMRLWAEPEGALTAQNDHLHWVDHAAGAFAIEKEKMSVDNYVCAFVTWRRETVLEMCAHMERVHQKPWISVVASSRKFSECMLYGGYVQGITDGYAHWRTSDELCDMRWLNPAPTEVELLAMVENLAPQTVGIGVQSFVPLKTEIFRRAVTGHLKKAA